jgi:lipoyl(octanoyl) transferase
LNVDMNLEPFQRINPCGYEGLAMTQLSALGAPTELERVAADLIDVLQRLLSRTAP